MPNLFVEAVTIRDGRVHHTVRELAVPPAKRILNVKILPDTQRYAPGQKAKVTVEVTELDGTPFRGTTVLSVYDRALEAIAGGGNVPEIKSFFWKWRRRHNTAYRSSLQRAGSILLRKGEKTLQTLGIFGHMLEDAFQDFERRSSGVRTGSRFGGGASGAIRGVSRREVMLKGGGPRNELRKVEGAPADRSSNDRNRAQPPQPIGADTLVQPTIRKNFADSAYWNAALSTDDQGRATIEFPMPENLTSWKVKVWAMGHGTRVGQGSTEVTTAKDLLLRLQAPRFFVQKDEVVLSAVVHNELPTHQEVQVVLELDGPCLRSLSPTVTTVRIEAHEQTRVDWRVKVEQEGEAIIRMKALSTEESDAMEQRFPVYVHGADKMVAASTVVAPDQTTGTFTFQVPAERRPEASRLVVRFSPTLAGAMVDALPYLANYPYGCTEQTLNRFLPTVITQKVLQRMGVDLALVREKRTNLNAQELGDAKERAAQWKRWNRNPVFDEAKVQEMVDAGIQHLAAMRVSDGGWGWFSGWGERSWPHTTATVVHGLMLARDNDVAVPEGLISGGLAWLARYEKEQIRRIENAPSKTRPYKLHADNLDALVHRVLTSGGQGAAKMRKFLYRDRNHLSVYGKGLLGLALVQVDGYAQELAKVIRNIEQYLVTDAENQTAYLKLPNGSYWWSWYGHEIEAHACYLQLLSRTDPKGDKARGLVKYLLNNRK
ncbi:MAG: alpha-2-macroglobulin family protein, partial [Myxococcota bacterium]